MKESSLVTSVDQFTLADGFLMFDDVRYDQIFDVDIVGGVPVMAGPDGSFTITNPYHRRIDANNHFFRMKGNDDIIKSKLNTAINKFVFNVAKTRVEYTSDIKTKMKYMSHTLGFDVYRAFCNSSDYEKVRSEVNESVKVFTENSVIPPGYLCFSSFPEFTGYSFILGRGEICEEKDSENVDEKVYKVGAVIYSLSSISYFKIKTE